MHVARHINFFLIHCPSDPSHLFDWVKQFLWKSTNGYPFKLFKLSAAMVSIGQDAAERYRDLSEHMELVSVIFLHCLLNLVFSCAGKSKHFKSVFLN